MMFRGKPAALQKAHADRAAAAKRAGDLEVSRSGRLVDGADVAEIDQIDADIAAEKRKVAILDERIVALEGDAARQRRADLEQRRNEAVKAIRGKFAKREAIAAGIEAILKQLGEKFAQLSDDADIRKAWPFPLDLPSYFSWRSGSLSWETMRTLARLCRDMLPSAVLSAIASSHAGDGVMRALTPRGPEGVAAVYAAHAAAALETLAKINIHPVGDDAEERAA